MKPNHYYWAKYKGIWYIVNCYLSVGAGLRVKFAFTKYYGVPSNVPLDQVEEGTEIVLPGFLVNDPRPLPEPQEEDEEEDEDEDEET